MKQNGASTIGVWSDMEGHEIRTTLQILQLDHLPVRFLDGDGIPVRYKLRRVEGEPVHSNVVGDNRRDAGQRLRVRDGQRWIPYEKCPPGQTPLQSDRVSLSMHAESS